MAQMGYENTLAKRRNRARSTENAILPSIAGHPDAANGTLLKGMARAVPPWCKLAYRRWLLRYLRLNIASARFLS